MAYFTILGHSFRLRVEAGSKALQNKLQLFNLGDIKTKGMAVELTQPIVYSSYFKKYIYFKMGF